MTVLDASALLAFLQDEPGADQVETALTGGSVCSAANWSETVQKMMAEGGDWLLAKAVLDGYRLRIEPVLASDAEWAARRWRRGEGLSLGDRLCLALGERLDRLVLTADAAWGEGGRIRQLR